MDRNSLTPTERKVCNYIKRVRFTCPILLQVKFRLSRPRIQGILQTLWSHSYIGRPAKGLIVSLMGTSFDQDTLTWIDIHIGKHDK